MKMSPCYHSKVSPCRLKAEFREQGGAALIIILAFIVLLLVLLLAFFSRATLQEQISKSSSSYTVVDVFAEGATESIIGDLRQEIVAGSLATNYVTGGITNTLYYPLTNTTFEPAVSGFIMTNGLESLLKVSSITNFAPTNSTLYTSLGNNPITNRASIDSTTNVSLNGRSVSTSRWNQPLFITRANPSDTNTTDTTPTNTFPVPTWVLVARDGSNPTNTTVSTNMLWSTTNSSTVIGRYAYAVYDEGYGLDANVAGYPNDGTQTTGTSASNYAYKSGEGFADLTQIGLTTNQIAALVGWRNSASIPVSSGTYPNYSFPAKPTNYFQMVMGNTNGFLSVATNVTSGGLTDRMFTSRQQLITFLENADPNGYTNALNSLRYLGTHTRDLNQPSFVPASNRPTVLNTNLGGNSAFTNTASTSNTITQDNIINPAFLSIRVTNSFTRNDGSSAIVGEPLVKQRFALNRIAWLTYKGPSANVSKLDPEMQALQNNGITYAFLQQGTALNIQKYFGLKWNSSGNGGGYWTYNVNNGNGSGVGVINTLPSIAAVFPHDPDFFELLKASIAVGSLGKSAVTSSGAVASTNKPAGVQSPALIPSNYRYARDSSVDYHIIQIGANIINQFHADSFPRRIIFNDGSSRGTNEFDGVTDLPYLTYLFNGVLRSTSQANVVQVPVVWNVYDPNGTRYSALTPTNFQITITSSDPANLFQNPVWVASEGTDSNGLPAFSYNAISNKTTKQGSIISDAIQFSGGTNTNAFREPTWLAQKTTPNGLSLIKPNGNYITCIDSYPIRGISESSNTAFAPFVIGNPIPTNLVMKSNDVVLATTAYIGSGNDPSLQEHRIYFTYRVQYFDTSSGTYITYDTKYGRVQNGIYYFCNTNQSPAYTPCIGGWSDIIQHWSWGASIDPRTPRFGLFTGGLGSLITYNEWPAAPSVACFEIRSTTWIDSTNLISLPLRPDQSGGHLVFDSDQNDPTVTQGPDAGRQNATSVLCADMPMTDVPYPTNAAGWSQYAIITYGSPTQFVPAFSFGMYVQNNVSTPFYVGRFVPDPNVDNFNDNLTAYYADADGVVRRGCDPYVRSGRNTYNFSASNPVGQPMAACMYNPPYSTPYLTNLAVYNQLSSFTTILPISTNQIVPSTVSPFSQSQSRPLFLHRPFRSVAELGYVFRDLPWKNIDFFTPESADTALLDVFCINPTSDPNNLVAGKLDLNTRQTNVLAAVVSGAYVDDPKVTNLTIGTLSTNLASNVAIALLNFTSTNTTISTNGGPLMNIGQLVGRYVSNTTIPAVPTGGVAGINGLTGINYKDGKYSYSGFSGIFTTNAYKTTNFTDLCSAYYNALQTNTTYPTFIPSMINIQRFHEAPIRALSSAGQTRVWNLMIDVIAQTGRYPSSASALNNFSVDGEQRYWVHLSIDRLTGAVIDKQIEVVKE